MARAAEEEGEAKSDSDNKPVGGALSEGDNAKEAAVETPPARDATEGVSGGRVKDVEKDMDAPSGSTSEVFTLPPPTAAEGGAAADAGAPVPVPSPALAPALISRETREQRSQTWHVRSTALEKPPNRAPITALA